MHKEVPLRTDFILRTQKKCVKYPLHALKPWNRTLRILRDAWSYNLMHTMQKKKKLCIDCYFLLISHKFVRIDFLLDCYVDIVPGIPCFLNGTLPLAKGTNSNIFFDTKCVKQTYAHKTKYHKCVKFNFTHSVPKNKLFQKDAVLNLALLH